MIEILCCLVFVVAVVYSNLLHDSIVFLLVEDMVTMYGGFLQWLFV